MYILEKLLKGFTNFFFKKVLDYEYQVFVLGNSFGNANYLSNFDVSIHIQLMN